MPPLSIFILCVSLPSPSSSSFTWQRSKVVQTLKKRLVCISLTWRFATLYAKNGFPNSRYHIIYTWTTRHTYRTPRNTFKRAPTHTHHTPHTNTFFRFPFFEHASGKEGNWLRPKQRTEGPRESGVTVYPLSPSPSRPPCQKNSIPPARPIPIHSHASRKPLVLPAREKKRRGLDAVFSFFRSRERKKRVDRERERERRKKWVLIFFCDLFQVWTHHLASTTRRRWLGRCR